MRAKVEIALALAVVVLCSALVLTRPRAGVSPSWATSLAEECYEAVAGGPA